MRPQGKFEINHYGNERVKYNLLERSVFLIFGLDYLREIHVHIEIMIKESRILLRVQKLEQSGRRIALNASTNFVYLQGKARCEELVLPQLSSFSFLIGWCVVVNKSPDHGAAASMSRDLGLLAFTSN